MNKINEMIAELTVNDNSAIKIIQITDTHIQDEGAELFNDHDTTSSLCNVVNKIKSEEQDADLILLTGDLVHEPTKTAYQKLADKLFGLTAPLYCLAGNHDDPDMMEYIMGANGFESNRLIKAGNWLVILLNSHVASEHGGYLSEAELNFLQKSLQIDTECNCLIVLHHHPVSINSSWMDAMALVNANEFFNVVDKFEQVRGVIWGHIHQEFESNRNNIKLLGTPSTCLQFVPGSDVFAVDNKTPAYRKISLSGNGNVETKVIYI